MRRDSTNVDWRLNLAQTHNAVGVVQRKLGDLAGAERSHRAEIEIKEAVVARDTTSSFGSHGPLRSGQVGP